MDSKLIPVTTLKQVEKVAALADIIWRQHYTPMIGEEQVSYMLEELQSVSAINHSIQQENYLYYLVSSNKEEVGYLAIVPDSAGGLFLSKLYLLEHARGRGLAREAVDFSRELAEDRGLSPLWLTCNVHNLGTLKAYEALGFKNVGTQKGDIGAGYVMDDFILETEV